MAFETTQTDVNKVMTQNESTRKTIPQELDVGWRCHSDRF